MGVKALNQKIKELGVNQVAERAGLNKSTVSRYVRGERAYSLENYSRIEEAIRSLENERLRGRTSANEASWEVVEGVPWRIAFFDFVDALRATRSRALFEKPPSDELSLRETALLASIVLELCQELDLAPPQWATLSFKLEKPFFVTDVPALRIICLVESPPAFKRNNIFVGADFLSRA